MELDPKEIIINHYKCVCGLGLIKRITAIYENTVTHISHNCSNKKCRLNFKKRELDKLELFVDYEDDTKH